MYSIKVTNEIMVCIVMYGSDWPVICAIQSTARISKKLAARNADVLPDYFKQHLKTEMIDVTTHGHVVKKKKHGGFFPRFGIAWRSSLVRETLYLIVGIMAILIAEFPKFQAGDPDFSIFSITFECCSAFSGCGLSLGATGSYAALSVKFTTFSKLVVMLIMLLGRHRGIPLDIERTARMPKVMKHHDAAGDAL